jgi:DNA-binding CsgD family transcriptional regulator
VGALFEGEPHFTNARFADLLGDDAEVFVTRECTAEAWPLMAMLAIWEKILELSRTPAPEIKVSLAVPSKSSGPGVTPASTVLENYSRPTLIEPMDASALLVVPARMRARSIQPRTVRLLIAKSMPGWRHQHPAIGRRMHRAQSISEHLSRREWHRRALFAEVFRPRGMEDDLGLEVNLGSRVSLFVGKSRTRRTFTPEDRTLLTLMGPHFRAAWEQSQATLRLPLPRAVEHELGQGLVELNASGRVLACGLMSNHLLQSYFGADAAGATLPRELRNWFRGQQTAILRKPLCIRGASGRLIIRYVKDPNCPRYFLLLQEQRSLPDASDAAVLRILGLSRREQEVLFWVAQGKTNATVAHLLGISPGTIKRHLENIYSRLGVENRHSATFVRCSACRSIFNQVGKAAGGGIVTARPTLAFRSYQRI